MIKRNLWTLSIAVLLIVVLFLYTIMYTVQEGTAVVVRRFGAISKTTTTPGLNFKWPWPIESVKSYDQRVRLLDLPGTEITTRDEFLLIVDATVGWHIADAGIFWPRFQGSEADAEAMLKSRAASARQQAVTQTSLESIVSTKQNQKQTFEAFEALFRDQLVNAIDTNTYGIAIDMVKVSALKFPSSVSQKVNDRMVKERERLSDRYRSEGDSEAKIIRQRAESEAATRRNEADATARRTLGNAYAKEAESYKVFETDRELASFLRHCESLRTIFKERTTVVLSSEDEPFSLLRNRTPQTSSLPDSAEEQSTESPTPPQLD